MSNIPYPNSNGLSGLPQTLGRVDDAVPVFAATDPYVNPEETNPLEIDEMTVDQNVSADNKTDATQADFNTTAALEKALAQLNMIEAESAAIESTSQTSDDSASEESFVTLQPSVEDLAVLAPENASPEKSKPEVEIVSNEKHSAENPHQGQTQLADPSSTEPVSTEAGHFQAVKPDSLKSTDEGAELEFITSSTAVPAYHSETPVFGMESVFDVRDFSDSGDREPDPISGAYEVDPYCYDFSTDEEESESLASNHQTSTSTPEFEAAAEQSAAESLNRAMANQTSLMEPVTQDQHFVAKTGDVIQIDGDDGFDHIDLACFQVDDATIESDRILIDDQNGNQFEIRFRNIALAQFADGVQVELA